jgi:hypothetical protein
MVEGKISPELIKVSKEIMNRLYKELCKDVERDYFLSEIRKNKGVNDGSKKENSNSSGEKDNSIKD